MKKTRVVYAALIVAMAILTAIMLPNIINLWNQYSTLLALYNNPKILDVPIRYRLLISHDYSIFLTALSEYIELMAGLFGACIIIRLLTIARTRHIKLKVFTLLLPLMLTVSEGYAPDAPEFFKDLRFGTFQKEKRGVVLEIAHVVSKE
jgi:hypothetical protein